MKKLNADERTFLAEQIGIGKKKKWIADQLGRHPSTIGRELDRNRCPDGKYRCFKAQQRAVERKRYRTVTPKMLNGKLRRFVVSLLFRNWSPEQISSWLRLTGSKYQVSHQTIYKYVWRHPLAHPVRSSLRRRGRRPRKKKPGFINRARRERRSIHDRPGIVQRRGRVGDWELDLMRCHRNSGYLITAVDRRSGYTLISRSKKKNSGDVMDRIVSMFRHIPKRLRLTFTFDNGVEFYYFKRLEEELGVTVYFADPYNSGQRGTNENTNGLIRQYFDKQTSYGSISNKDIKRVVQLLNNRPRKRLNYQAPKTVFRPPQKIAIQI